MEINHLVTVSAIVITQKVLVGLDCGVDTHHCCEPVVHPIDTAARLATRLDTANKYAVETTCLVVHLVPMPCRHDGLPKESVVVTKIATDGRLRPTTSGWTVSYSRPVSFHLDISDPYLEMS